MKKILLTMICACFTLAASGLVYATPTKAYDKMDVTATVSNECSVVANNLEFGNYSSGANSTASTTVDVTCTSGANYTVTMDDGDDFSAGARHMSKGNELLAYNIYKEVGLTNIWGTGGGGVSGVSNVGTGSVQSIPVYGKIPSGQNVKSGNYKDDVKVEIDLP